MKPKRNAFVETFNGRCREERLNQHWFVRLADAERTIEQWRQDCNTAPTHSSLDNLAPASLHGRALRNCYASQILCFRIVVENGGGTCREYFGADESPENFIAGKITKIDKIVDTDGPIELMRRDGNIEPLVPPGWAHYSA